MKKTFSWLALLLAALMLLASCNTANSQQTTTPEHSTPTQTTPEETTPDSTTPEPEVTTPKPEETTPDTPVTPPEPQKKTLKVLAIGNSFSDDGMEHLAEILVGEGYTDFILGNLYIGGCSMDGHKARIDSGAKDYSFRTNTGSGWTTVQESIQYGLDYADWQIITIQQVSGYSGIPESYGNMQYIIDYVRDRVDPFVKIFFHMTWAYQSTSGHGDFAKYNKNQMQMYNAITSTVQTLVVGNWNIEGYIPSGTAIQNLRTSYLGDNLTRDGYHLSYDIGRYTAALTWYKELTGADITDLTTVPRAYSYISQYLPAIKEAVNNAIEKPFEVTPSTFTEYDASEMNDDDKTYLTALGLNPDDYELLPLGTILRAYYYSTSTAASSVISGDSTSAKFCATRIFTQEDLPVGSIINILSGYQYRLEGWQSLGKSNSLTRLNTTTESMIVSEELYTQYNYIGFNISRTNGASVTIPDLNGLRIYVPKTAE